MLRKLATFRTYDDPKKPVIEIMASLVTLKLFEGDGEPINTGKEFSTLKEMEDFISEQWGKWDTFAWHTEAFEFNEEAI